MSLRPLLAITPQNFSLQYAYDPSIMLCLIFWASVDPRISCNVDLVKFPTVVDIQAPHPHILTSPLSVTSIMTKGDRQYFPGNFLIGIAPTIDYSVLPTVSKIVSSNS